MKRIATLLISSLFAFAAQAQLLVSENFSNFTAGTVVGQGTPAWVTPNSSAVKASVVVQGNNTGSPTYAGYTSGQNYLTLDDQSGENVYKPFIGSTALATGTATTFFLSFVVNVPNEAGVRSTASAVTSLALRTSDGNNLCRFYIGDANSGASLRFGIGKSTTGSYSTNNYSFGTNYLIVIRYDIVTGTGNDLMYLWVNPTNLGTMPTTASAAVSITSGGDGTYSGNVNAFQFFQNSSTAQYKIDGISVAYGRGTTAAVSAWDDLGAAGAPLPVHFTSFQGKKQGGSNQLLWNVASEEQVRVYEVERSTDGSAFTAIGSVNAAGMPAYSYIDRQPVASAYYRIRAVDFDGKYLYSAIIALRGSSSSVVLKAYPTVTTGLVTIQHDAARKGASLGLFSQDGRVVRLLKPSEGEQQTRIDLGNLPAGSYYVRFDNGTGENATLKLMRQ